MSIDFKGYISAEGIGGHHHAVINEINYEHLSGREDKYLCQIAWDCYECEDEDCQAWDTFYQTGVGKTRLETFFDALNEINLWVQQHSDTDPSEYEEDEEDEDDES